MRCTRKVLSPSSVLPWTLPAGALFWNRHMASQSRKSAASTAAPKKPRVDWDAVERDYRATQMTLRELEAKHGITNSRIAQKAKAGAWTRDLLPAIRQATDARLIQAAVSEELSKQSTQATQSLSNVVLAAAEVNTQIILGHRHGLNRITAIKDVLLDQIEQAARLMPDLAEVIEMARSEDDRGMDKANDAMKKAMARSSLVDDLKKLAEIDERVRKGEREAFSIENGQQDDAPGDKQKRVLVEFVDVVPK